MQKRMKPPDPAPHVPLRPVAFAVLAALAEGPRPGIEILDQVNTTVPRRPLLGPGTLYRLMRELRQAGLITRTDPTPARSGPPDERQAHHQLTPLGVAVLREEVARLRRTIALAGPVLPARLK
jgi:DNA-binding PadR family transcriptional regulator